MSTTAKTVKKPMKKSEDVKISVEVDKKSAPKNPRRPRPRNPKKFDGTRRMTKKEKKFLKSNSKRSGDLSYFNAPLTKFQIAADFTDIVLAAQTCAIFVIKRNPMCVVGADAIPPSKLAAYFILYAMQYAADHNCLVWKLTATPPTTFLLNTNKVPAVWARWVADYFTCYSSPNAMRILTYSSDYAIPTSSINPDYVANSISSIQDVSNLNFGKTFGCFMVKANLNTLDQLVENSYANSYLFSNNSFISEDKMIASLNSFVTSCNVPSVACETALKWIGREGASFSFPCTFTPGPTTITWNNSTKILSPYVKIDPDLCPVYTPNYSASNNSMSGTAFFEFCVPMPVQSNLNVTDVNNGTANLTLVAEHLQKYFFLGTHSNFVEKNNFKKSFIFFGFSIKKNFCNIQSYAVDYTLLSHKLMTAFIKIIQKRQVPGATRTVSSMTFVMLQWWIDHAIRQKVFWSGAMDLTKSLGAMSSICIWQNFFVEWSIIESSMPLFAAILLREIGVTSNGLVIYVPGMNLNSSPDNTSNSAKVITSGSTYNQNPLTLAGTQTAWQISFNDYNSYPMYPSNTWNNNMQISGAPLPTTNGDYDQNGNGYFFGNGQIVSAFPNSGTVPSIGSGIFSYVFSFVTLGASLASLFTSYLQSFLAIGRNVTLANAPPKDGLGGTSTMAIRQSVPLSKAANISIYEDTYDFASTTRNAFGVMFSYSIQNISFAYLAPKTHAATALAVGIRSKYLVSPSSSSSTPPTTAPIIFSPTSFVATSTVEAGVTGTFIEETTGATSASISLYEDAEKTHAHEKTTMEGITYSKVKEEADCTMPVVEMLTSTAATILKWPPTKLLSKSACEIAKTAASTTMVAPVAKFIDCNIMEKGVDALAKIATNMNTRYTRRANVKIK